MIKAARIAFATLVLGGCSHQPASDESHLVATVVTESEFTEVNVAVTPEMLLGRWGFGGVCENDIVNSSWRCAHVARGRRGDVDA